MFGQSVFPPREDFKLVFAATGNSTIPKLQNIGSVPVGRDQLRLWEQELSAAHEQICNGGNLQTFRFQTRLTGMPMIYRLHVKQTNANGVFRFELTPIDDSFDDNLRQTPEMRPLDPHRFDEPDEVPGDWPARAFVQALASMLKQTPHKPAVQAGVATVLEELDDLAERCPEKLLLLLAAGYVHFAQHRGTGDERELAFMAASFAIDELCAADLAPPASSPPPGTSRPLYGRSAWQMLRELVKRL